MHDGLKDRRSLNSAPRVKCGKISACFPTVYSNIENLVLWGRSAKLGYAVNQGRGMMEYWNAGVMGLME